MWSYILKRLLLMIPTLIGVLTLTFAVIQFVPGGPVEQAVQELRKGATEQGAVPFGLRAHTGVDAQQLAQLKALYGFDKPPLERYWLMLKRFARFDLGESYFRHQSVWSLVVQKLPVSISIGLWTFFLTYLISVPLGIAKAVRNGSPFDVATSLVVLVGYAIPGFVLGVLLLVLFGGGSFWQLFPLRGTSDNFAQLSLVGKVLDYLWHIALPITASVVGSFAVVTMLTKNAFLDQIRRQYVLTARAKGLRAQRAVEARVPQCDAAADRRLSGRVHRRVLHRQPADRDAVLARRPRAAVVRVGRAARLSGRARHAVPVHADRGRDQADLRSLLCVGRSAHSIRHPGALT